MKVIEKSLCCLSYHLTSMHVVDWVGPVDLKGMIPPSVVSLDLSGCRLYRNLDSISNMTHLRTLILSDRLRHLPPSACFPTSLTDLRIPTYSFLAESLHLKSLPLLQHLTATAILNGQKSGLQHLLESSPSLTSLQLMTYTNIVGVSLATTDCICTRLKNLVLDEQWMDGRAFINIVHHFPNLITLTAHICQRYHHTHHLSKLVSLTNVSLELKDRNGAAGSEFKRLSDDEQREIVKSLQSISSSLRHLTLDNMTRDPNRPTIAMNVYHLSSLQTLSLANDSCNCDGMRYCMARLPITLHSLSLSFEHLPLLPSLTRLIDLKYLSFQCNEATLPLVATDDSAACDPFTSVGMKCAITSPSIRKIWSSLNESRIIFESSCFGMTLIPLIRQILKAIPSLSLLDQHELHLLSSPTDRTIIKKLIAANLVPPFGYQASSVILPDIDDDLSTMTMVNEWSNAHVAVRYARWI
jgi:hypothetical protein